MKRPRTSSLYQERKSCLCCNERKILCSMDYVSTYRRLLLNSFNREIEMLFQTTHFSTFAFYSNCIFVEIKWLPKMGKITNYIDFEIKIKSLISSYYKFDFKIKITPISND